MSTKKHIGIDSGSTMCKAVLFCDDKVLDSYIIKTGWNPRLSATESLEFLLQKNGIVRSEVIISATGYGREAIDFADDIFTEITCHAFGGIQLLPETGGIIDIGGQDSKVIKIANKKVSDFLMNDKCAAGPGRFLSMACETMGIDLQDIDEFVDLSDAIPINSMCTVFAESEIIGLLSMQKERSQIMAGVLQSIAQKIRQMAGKMDFDTECPLLMTGGLSQSKALVSAISEATGLHVITQKQAIFAGAVGACICADKKVAKLEI